MSKNTGKPSEEDFEDRWARLGKAAHVHRFVDAAEVRGRTGKTGFTRKAPADYLLTHNGRTTYAEVKSTQDDKAFRFSLLRAGQSAAAAMVIAAGGTYEVFVHRLLTNEWFRFPYSLVAETKAAGKASIPWSALQPYRWSQ